MLLSKIKFWFDSLIVSTVISNLLVNDTMIRRELQTDCMLDKIDEYRRNWLLHLQRMPQNRIHLKSYHYSPQGKRTVGRPKKRWREQLSLWRRNGPNGSTLDVYADDDDDTMGYAIDYVNVHIAFNFRQSAVFVFGPV
jgi:hypothetical protein